MSITRNELANELADRFGIDYSAAQDSVSTYAAELAQMGDTVWTEAGEITADAAEDIRHATAADFPR